MAKKSWKKVPKKPRFCQRPKTISSSLLKRILHYIKGFPSAPALIDKEITPEIVIAMQSVAGAVPV